MKEEVKAPFKVGDKIKFKTWNTMIKKYGKTPIYKQPDVHYGMPFIMYEEFKDTVFTVKEITLNKYRIGYIWDIKTEEPQGGYSFQSQMFKLVKPKKKTTKRKCKFKIGDKVRIRTWDDMAKKFGVRPSGGIDVPFVFTEEMNKELSEKVFTIRNIRDDEFEGVPTYKLMFEEYCSWLISEQMCEKVKPEKKTKQKLTVEDDSATKIKVDDVPFFTKEEQVKILDALKVIINKIKGE